ncbi:MAG: TIR domain-containing protein [Candidatus Aminicenantes bacterium]|nr:TIR domain-containing protein [Candidatus Aminicenantes bacterium]NIQ65399.1 TIR domain-containing protein [Candidatus Aminicenantes bacterium]NIT21401.1 TIR domain-containing protein [Candidatus Aminicenantes bacterium]
MKGCMVFVVPVPPDAVEWRLSIEHELKRRHRLVARLDEADVVLVVIGRNFLPFTRHSASMMKGLLNEALAQGKPIVPLLIDGARMPTHLPAGLQDLAYSEALMIESEQELPGLIARILATPVLPPSMRSPNVDECRGEQQLVFVAYRRDDSVYWADALTRALIHRLGRESVFFDIGSEQPGRDYRSQISSALARATDVVVVIGPGFLEPVASGVRRLDRSDDQLRSEIRTALRGKKRMHIVLTGQASLPARVGLPNDIAALVDTRSVHKLRSAIAAGQMVNKMFPLPTSSPFVSDLPVLREWQQQQQAYQTHADLILAELAAHGWTKVSQCSRIDKAYTVRNDRFSGFRLVLQVPTATVCLEERIKSFLRAGLPRWVTREVFSVSPRETTAARVMRLPDQLLDAVLDPVQYLDRMGRFKINKRKHPIMRQEIFLGNVRYASQPKASAIEAYQQTRRRMSARGGLTALRRIKTLVVNTEDAQGIAFHPNGEWLAVATNSGAALVGTRDWQTGTVLDSPASWQAVGFSRDGWLALGSDRGQLSIWDPNGSLIADRIALYKPRSLLRRIQARSGRIITTISWSPTGEAMACCGGEAAWVYRPATGEIHHWTLPLLTPPLMDYDSGAHFIAGGEALLVYGLKSFVCVLRLPNLEVWSVIQNGIWPNQKQIADETGAVSGGAPFSNIYCAEPSPTRDVVACAGEDGQIGLYDLRSWELLANATWFEPVRHGMRTHVAVVSFCPDGKLLAAISSGQRLVVGDAATLEPMYESPEVLDFVFGGRYTPRVAWSPDSSLFAVNRLAGRIEIWGI